MLNTSRSGLYYRPKLPTKDEVLKDQILYVLSDNPAYGHKRIALALGIGKKRARRVMHNFGIKPFKRGVRFKKRRDERRPEAVFNNEIKEACPIAPNITYVGDFTYIKYRGQFIYVATYMDLFTREIVGLSVSNRHTKDLVLNALLSALETTGYKLPKVIHTDQGSEYNCRPYIKFVSYLGISISMSKKASPWENGYQESFYSNFKLELGLEFDRFNSIGELVEGIYQQINYHNTKRIHTSLRMPPAIFKQRYLEKYLEYRS